MRTRSGTCTTQSATAATAASTDAISPRTTTRLRREGAAHYRHGMAGHKTVVLLGVLLAAGPARAAPLAPLPAQPPDVAWPTRQWPTGGAGVPEQALEPLLAVTAASDPLLRETRAVGGRPHRP